MRLQHVNHMEPSIIWLQKIMSFLRLSVRLLRSYDPEIIVMGLSGSEMIRAAKDLGLKAASEVFADRAYEEDGTLVNRRKEGGQSSKTRTKQLPA